jgi:hypothetical protein
MVNGKSSIARLVRTGFVSAQWKFPAETQKRILIEQGVPEKRIIEEKLEDALAMLRGDEVLETAGGFRALGGGRFAIMGAFNKIRGAGKVLVDCETGMRSDTNAVDLLNIALAKIHGQQTAASHEDAVERGKNGADVRWQPVREARMGLFEAKAIWFDTKIRTNEKALKRMKGWKRRSVYEEFGPSGRPPGNPGGKRKS